MPWLPAAAGLLLLAGVVLAWKVRGRPEASKPTSSAPPAAGIHPPAQRAPSVPGNSGAQGASAQASLPPAEHDHDVAPTLGEIKPYPVENVPPTGAPPVLTEEDLARQRAEDEAATKPPLEAEQKIAKAVASLPNLEAAAAQIEKQIEDATRQGRTAEAQEKRVRAKRMRERIDRIKQAAERGTDPSGPLDEL